MLKTYLPSWEPGPSDLNVQVASEARRLHAKGRASLPPVKLLLEDVTRRELRALYATAHAFVLPTRYRRRAQGSAQGSDLVIRFAT